MIMGQQQRRLRGARWTVFAPLASAAEIPRISSQRPSARLARLAVGAERDVLAGASRRSQRRLGTPWPRLPLRTHPALEVGAGVRGRGPVRGPVKQGTEARVRVQARGTGSFVELDARPLETLLDADLRLHLVKAWAERSRVVSWRLSSSTSRPSVSRKSPVGEPVLPPTALPARGTRSHGVSPTLTRRTCSQRPSSWIDAVVGADVGVQRAIRPRRRPSWYVADAGRATQLRPPPGTRRRCDDHPRRRRPPPAM